MTIKLKDIWKDYDNDGGKAHVLKGINLTIEKGEFVSIVGKSGSGKSTLLNMMTAIDTPSSGEITVAGMNLVEIPKRRMARWRGIHIGIIFQFFQLIPTLTVMENVMLPMDFCRMYTLKERKIRAQQLLEQVEMEEHLHKMPASLSGGQQQRVAIARALANDPPILTADEPTGSLDSKTADMVFHTFEELSQTGKTIVIVTHDQELARKTHRCITVSDGTIIKEGSPFQKGNT